MNPAFQNKPQADDLWHVVCVPQDVNNIINTFLPACLWSFLIISWNSTEHHTEYEVSMINQWFPVLWLWFNQRLLLCAAHHFAIIIIKLSGCNDILLHTVIPFKAMFAKRENWVEVLQLSEVWEDYKKSDLDRAHPLAINLNNRPYKLRKEEYLKGPSYRGPYESKVQFLASRTGEWCFQERGEMQINNETIISTM